METIAEQFLSSANFQQAWLQVAKKKGCAGSDGETVAQFKQNLNSNLANLRNAIASSNGLAFRKIAVFFLLVRSTHLRRSPKVY